MLRPSHIPQYARLALLFTRYGRKDFQLELEDASEAAIPEEEGEEPLEPGIEERAAAFAEALEQMGPTFVKFGQVLSTRPDIVPPPYIGKLEELQDEIEPFSFAEVEKIVEEELGAKISKIFAEFDDVPMAAASLGQVHHAMLRDGREVVVKVQRPGVRDSVAADLEVFRELAAFLDQHSTVARKMNLTGSLRQIRRSLSNELNYLHEARNIETFRRNLAEFPEIYVPAVLRDLTTTRVLTMELIRGKKVSRITPLEIIDHDYAELAAVATRAYLKQICVDGIWHSDPHPGNVFVREDQLVLLDFGMVSRISGEMQDEIVKLLLGVTENRGEEVAEVCMRLGQEQPGFDRDAFVRDVSEMVGVYHDADLAEANAGRIVFQVIGVATGNELQVPAELAMLAKTLLQLDGITRRLDPEFNPREVIRDYAESIITKRVRQKLHPRNYYSALIDLNALATELPRRLRGILRKVEAGELSIAVRVSEIEHLLKALTKIANRLTVGLIIAAIIVGSALIMNVPSGFRILGYPGLAILGFLGATVLGFYLVVTILIHDRRDRLKARGK
ncbi:MAG TPA: AarF/UbiB family protein [Thermoanaerobaculia bacterium]|nr:AarF/UbiB family protein [Thermoanaerobaculia bacterium]